MKKFAVAAILSLMAFVALPASAQVKPRPRAPRLTVTAHSVSMTWQASPTVGIAGYNVYRALCSVAVAGTPPVCPTASEGTFAKLNAAVLTTPTYVDSAVTGGQNYSYYETSICPSTGCGSGVNGESLPSNHAGAAVPSSLPQPGGNLVIGTVALNHTSATQDTLVVSWTDTPGSTGVLTVFGANDGVLGIVPQKDAGGNYGVAVGFRPQSGVFSICSSTGFCIVQSFVG